MKTELSNEHIFAQAREMLREYEKRLEGGFRFQLSIVIPKVSRQTNELIHKPTSEESENEKL